MALELAQIGKFAKALKSGKYVKYGEKYVVNSAKKFIVEEAPDVIIDVVAQFIINLVKLDESSKVLRIEKAWNETSIKSAVLQKSFSINQKKNVELEQKLYCALEILSQLNDGSFTWEKLTQGVFNCTIECLLLGSKYGLRSDPLVIFCQDYKNRQRLLDFFKDSQVYSLIENLVKDYIKQ